MDKIENKVSEARQFKEQMQFDESFSRYYDIYQIINQLNDQIAFLCYLNDNDYVRNTIHHIYSLKKNVDMVLLSKTDTSERNIENVCFYLVNALKNQTGKLDETMYIENITYKDTRMASSFSNRFTRQMQKTILQSGYYKLTGKAAFNAKTGNYEGIKYILTGNYKDINENIRINIVLKNGKSGEIIDAIDDYLPVEWIENNNLKIIPDNAEYAFQQFLAFNKDDIINGGLNIEIWSNKGNNNLIYTEGDTQELYVRANRECYLRCEYYVADGEKALLLDNYYITSDLANKVYKLPYKFRCTGPFGLESLVLNAQTTKFEPLNTTKKGSHTFINENSDQIVYLTRNFVAIENDVQHVEKRMIFTTLVKQDQ